VTQKGIIDTERFSTALRRRGIDTEGRRILVTHFDGSDQAKDFTVPWNCDGFGRIHHFRRVQGQGWPLNPLPIDPAADALALPAADIIKVQVFQNAICSWRCWYCFVDFDLLSANPKHAAFKSASEVVDLYLREPERSPVIDLSGGQPDLVPEWTLWVADEIYERGLARQVYLWSDDNLSNDFLWRFLTPNQLDRLSSYPNYGRVGCFKGFDEHSFSFNTLASPELFRNQFKLMSRLVKSGFDVYGYATFTSDLAEHIGLRMREFVDRLQSDVHALFPLRTVPLRVKEFTPTASRIKPEHRRALEIQQDAVSAWNEELEHRFTEELRSRPIFENRLRTVA
jgi:uncharacterized Fe-S cluster-containing radical SAM superfamily protein